MGSVAKARRYTEGAAKRKRGLPLALVIARYFAYVLAVVGLLAVVVLLLFSLLVSSRTVYIASYADENSGKMVEMLESGEVVPADIPACYRWIVFDSVGDAVASDMSERDQAAAGEALRQGSSAVNDGGLLGGSRRQVTAMLPSGEACALQYDFLPVFTSRELRDALPDPQMLLVIVFFGLFAVAMTLIAMRASRVIARKMRPLVDAASHIEQQDLNFAVGSTNVREVNEVLAAMERMRTALNESLHARWAADEARRRQVSALAHDLKTPLAIARWNADLLHETPLDGDQEACAEALSDSVGRMDDYVRLLVETSWTGVVPVVRERVEVLTLAAQVEQQASQLCEAQGIVLDCSCAVDGPVSADAMQLLRATMNLVSNAVQYAPMSSTVTVRFGQRESLLQIVVEDKGPGFSSVALEHGKERFFRDAQDRSSEGSHYGLGLSIVEDIVAAHDGTLSLSNREGGGASCLIEVPLRGHKRETIFL